MDLLAPLTRVLLGRNSHVPQKLLTRTPLRGHCEVSGASYRQDRQQILVQEHSIVAAEVHTVEGDAVLVTEAPIRKPQLRCKHINELIPCIKIFDTIGRYV